MDHEKMTTSKDSERQCNGLDERLTRTFIQDQEKRERLSAIYEDVEKMALEISKMNDPLPHQIDTSMPGYITLLKAQINNLRKIRYPVILTGSRTSGKSAFANTFLGDNIMPTLNSGSSRPVKCFITNDVTSWIKLQPKDASKGPLIVSEIEDLQEELFQLLRTDSEKQQYDSYNEVQIYSQLEALKNGLILIEFPEVGVEPEVDASLMGCLDDAIAFIQVIDCSGDVAEQANKTQQFVKSWAEHSASNDVQYISASSLIFVCDIPQDASSQDRCDVMSAIKHGCPGCEQNHILMLRRDVTGKLSPTKTADLNAVYSEIDLVIKSNLECKIDMLFSCLQSFVSRTIHHLKAFLSQTEKSHAERVQTFNSIRHRLEQLTLQADEFFQQLNRDVEIKSREAVNLLREYLMRPEVQLALSEWRENETPFGATWQEVDVSMRNCINHRIVAELRQWEADNNFFRNLRSSLVHDFETKFSCIEKRLIAVENMIARHEMFASMHIGDDVHSDEARRPGSFESLYNWNLSLTHKIVIGLASPILVPIGLAVALIGLSVYGGIAAKDRIAEHIADKKLKEYMANPVKYMETKTIHDATQFAKSRALDDYVRSELSPAYRCIAQLQETIPKQIEADKAQVESLRNDDREGREYERFYQPINEVFTFHRRRLIHFKLQWLRRRRYDIDSRSIEPITDDSAPICSGLVGTINEAFLTEFKSDGSRTKRLVAVKRMVKNVEAHSVDDYLAEEEAYRLQACANIVKFIGMSKPSPSVCHVIEALQSNLREHLMNKLTLCEQIKDTEKFSILKTNAIQVVRGLDYLHDRGWVHFDLSLDTVAVDQNGTVKLTNISLRKMVCVELPVSRERIRNYAYIPYEVLASLGSAYTPASDMYAMGLMMWEMWTGLLAYYEEIHIAAEPLDTFDKFLCYIESGRPRTIDFHSDGADKESPFTSNEAQEWCTRLQQCWAEAGRRLGSKAWLQLMDDSRPDLVMSIQEAHFS